MDKNILKALLLCPLFEKLTPGEIEEAMSGVNYQLVRYNKKEIYARTGEPTHLADIVISGEMVGKMENKSGRCVKIITENTGKLIASTFIFSKNRFFPMTIETVRPTTLLSMTTTEFLQLINSDQRIMMNYISLLSTIGTNLACRIRQLTLFTVREKVAHFLSEEAKRRNTNTIMLTISRQELADNFAIQKYSLQRVLSEFARSGAIRLDGKSITILDCELMMSLASR